MSSKDLKKLFKQTQSEAKSMIKPIDLYNFKEENDLVDSLYEVLNIISSHVVEKRKVFDSKAFRERVGDVDMDCYESLLEVRSSFIDFLSKNFDSLMRIQVGVKGSFIQKNQEKKTTVSMAFCFDEEQYRRDMVIEFLRDKFSLSANESDMDLSGTKGNCAVLSFETQGKAPKVDTKLKTIMEDLTKALAAVLKHEEIAQKNASRLINAKKHRPN